MSSQAGVARSVRARAFSSVLALTMASLLSGVVAAPVSALTAQTIDFALPPTSYTANLVHLSATASSGLPVSFASTTVSVCTVDDDVALLLSPGTCTIRASQAGDWQHAAAPDVTRSLAVLQPPDGPQPQTITFSLPPAGYVGATIILEGYTNSPLPLSYTSLTPSVCVTDGTFVALDAAGTCTLRASQSGNQEWRPAASVTASMESRAAPFGAGTTSLGKYAFNGPISSVELDEATGDTWVAGNFTQVGVRTGSVARVNGPGSGSDGLDAASPDVIAGQLYLMADDTTGYFVSGLVGSINGDGTQRAWLTRMNADGTRDSTWTMSTGCSSDPEWAKGQPRFDLGGWIGAPVQMSPTGAGASTVGLTLITKATGAAKPTGDGDTPCGGRTWASIPPLPVLASCATWNTCVGNVMNASYDSASHTLLTDVIVLRRQGTTGATSLRSWLVAYDTVAGTRKWAIPTTSVPPADFPASAEWLSYIARMAVVDGSVLLGGSFRLDAVNTPAADVTSMILVDLATGTLLQRWNRHGEQSLADPQGPAVTAATSCLPMAADDEVFRFATPQAGHVIGYGQPSGETYPVCDYSVSGVGLAARLAAAQRGSLGASQPPSWRRQLPDTLVGGRYVAGTFDAFDLQTDQPVANWHPSPSRDFASIVPLGSDVVMGGEFTFLHGTPAAYVARLSKDLAPVGSFASGMPVPVTPGMVIGMRRLGTSLLLFGWDLGTEDVEIAALDGTTGAVTWTSAPSTHSTMTIGVDAAQDAFYAGGSDGTGHPGLRRYVREGAGFSLDPSFAPVLTGINGRPPDVLALDVIAGRLYVGGDFSKIGGVARQGLARYTATGTLDSWAPKLLSEMGVGPGTAVELGPRFFRELGGRTVVGGSFVQYPDGGGEPVGTTVSISPLLAYDSGTGARVRPATGSSSWFGDSSAATDAAVLGSSLYVALGDSGIAAFDATTLDYQSYRSIRTFSGWGNNAIYALLTRPGTVALAGAGNMAAAAVATDPSLVVGGDVPRWKARTAGNVVALGAGVLNTDRTPPTVSATKAAPRTGVALSAGLPFWVSWSGADTGGAGIARYEVGQSRNGGAWTILKVKVTSPRLSVSLSSGSTYRFRVRAIDRAGNVGSWRYSTTGTAGLTQQTSSAISWSTGWRTTTSTVFSGGSARYARTYGSRASYRVTARAIAFVTTAATTRGKARIYVDGTLVATVDLRASKTTYRYVAWYRQWSSSSTHTVRIVVLGTAGRPRVDVDGFVTWK